MPVSHDADDLMDAEFDLLKARAEFWKVSDGEVDRAVTQILAKRSKCQPIRRLARHLVLSPPKDTSSFGAIHASLSWVIAKGNVRPLLIGSKPLT
jgi:hypothetical protein